MKILSMMTTIIMILMLILTTILNLTSKKSFNDQEKSSPFECGFDPSSCSRLPFSLQFFLIAIIFLIFDIELALLLPLITIMKMTSLNSFMSISLFFIIILLFGLYHEWKQGALNWSY